MFPPEQYNASRKNLKNNKDKSCDKMSPVFTAEEFREYPNTQVRKLTPNEIEKYMSER